MGRLTLKVQLVTKNYTQTFDLDYGDTFSLMPKIALICLFVSMVIVRHWPLHLLDIKNVFPLRDLEDEIYMSTL